MSQKTFLVKVDVDLKKITCPGVWLCSNGPISIQLCMLDSTIQTQHYKPIFPIKILKKYTFYKKFHKGKLTDLQKKLGKEWIYIEFIQWVSDGDGCVLAHFQTTLDELLYPKSCDSMYENVHMDLLMEPTEIFPGTLGPKLLIKTKTTIEENECINYTNRIQFPKMIVSLEPASKRNKTKRVCHSLTYNRSDRCWSDVNKTNGIKEVANGNISVGTQSFDNLKSSQFSRHFCEEYCPTCYRYQNLVSTSQFNEGHRKCRCGSDRHFTVDDSSLREMDTNCICCDKKTPSTLARRLHERLAECLCTNAKLVRGKCNEWVDLE